MVPCLRRTCPVLDTGDGAWIPACAGMTDKETFQNAKMLPKSKCQMNVKVQIPKMLWRLNFGFDLKFELCHWSFFGDSSPLIFAPHHFMILCLKP
jgi:hypothetical protein